MGGNARPGSVAQQSNAHTRLVAEANLNASFGALASVAASAEQAAPQNVAASQRVPTAAVPAAEASANVTSGDHLSRHASDAPSMFTIRFGAKASSPSKPAASGNVQVVSARGALSSHQRACAIVGPKGGIQPGIRCCGVHGSGWWSHKL